MEAVSSGLHTGFPTFALRDNGAKSTAWIPWSGRSGERIEPIGYVACVSPRPLSASECARGRPAHRIRRREAADAKSTYKPWGCVWDHFGGLLPGR